jgi:hypothetical protein
VEYAREMGNRAEAVGLDRHPIHPRDWRFTRATGCSVPNSLFWRIVCAPGCKRARAGTGPVCCEWVTDRRSTPRDAATPDLDDPRAGPHTIYLLRVRARSSPFDALRRSACACAAFPRSAFAVRRSTRSGARLAPAPRFRARPTPAELQPSASGIPAFAISMLVRRASAFGLRRRTFVLSPRLGRFSMWLVRPPRLSDSERRYRRCTSVPAFWSVARGVRLSRRRFSGSLSWRKHAAGPPGAHSAPRRLMAAAAKLFSESPASIGDATV